MKIFKTRKSRIFTFRAFGIAAMLLLFSLACSSQTEFDDAALKSVLQNPDGEKVSFDDVLKAARGKTTVIEIWASWCSDCIKAMREFKELQKSNPDLNYVFISFDKSEESWKKGIAKYSLQGEHFWAADGMNGEFAKAIDANWIPRYIIVDEQGKVLLYNANESDFKKINTIINNKKR